MPDDGGLVDFIPHIAVTTPELQRKLLVEQPNAALLASRSSSLMPLEKPYLDIPGTTLFDAEQCRAKAIGSTSSACRLMKADNRVRFKADDAGLLGGVAHDRRTEGKLCWRVTSTECIAPGRQHLLSSQDRLNRLGKSFQQMAGSMTGMTEAGISRHDDRRRPLASKATAAWVKMATPSRTAAPGQKMKPLAPPRAAERERVRSVPEGTAMRAASSQAHIAFAGRLGSGPALDPQQTWTTDMAKITASVYTSHVPAIGAALGPGQSTPIPTGSRCSRAMNIRQAMDCREQPARRGFPGLQRPCDCLKPGASSRPSPSAPRPQLRDRPTKASARARCPRCMGHPELAWHIAQSRSSKTTSTSPSSTRWPVDHGLTVPLSP